MMLRRWSLTVVCTAFLGAGAAVAATQTDEPGSADIGFRKNITLSPQEMQQQTREYYAKMREITATIAKLETRARRDRDLVKVNCVNDKLAQSRGHVNLTEQSMTALDQAISRADDGARQHEFTRVTILYQKVVVLGTEAEQCVGEDVSYVGATRVDVEVDPSIPQEDPTEPALPVPVVERPPECSPFV